MPPLLLGKEKGCIVMCLNPLPKEVVCPATAHARVMAFGVSPCGRIGAVGAGGFGLARLCKEGDKPGTGLAGIMKNTGEIPDFSQSKGGKQPLGHTGCLPQMIGQKLFALPRLIPNDPGVIGCGVHGSGRYGFGFGSD